MGSATADFPRMVAPEFRHQAYKHDMKPVPENVVAQLAEAFCFGRNGFAREEIPLYFAQYQGGVPTLRSLRGATKADVFEACVGSLTPSNQRLALYDLCDNPPPSKHLMPSEGRRLELLYLLLQADGRSTLGVDLSRLSIRGVREQWMTAASRIPSAPAGAITAARSLVETTCKTILQERAIPPDSSGDLGKLYKQVRTELGIDPKTGATQNVHQLVGGLIQTVDGLAGLSNKAGDRHGLEAGTKIHDVSYAGLAVHAAGTVALFLAAVHKDTARGPTT